MYIYSEFTSGYCVSQFEFIIKRTLSSLPLIYSSQSIEMFVKTAHEYGTIYYRSLDMTQSRKYIAPYEGKTHYSFEIDLRL